MDYMKHIELENIHEAFDDYKIRKDIVTQIVDMTDKVILEAIIEFAKSAGITDLYLLDKEFIKTALKREIARRKEVSVMVDKYDFSKMFMKAEIKPIPNLQAEWRNTEEEATEKWNTRTPQKEE